MEMKAAIRGRGFSSRFGGEDSILSGTWQWVLPDRARNIDLSHIAVNRASFCSVYSLLLYLYALKTDSLSDAVNQSERH